MNPTLHPRVTIGHPRVTIGHLRDTMGHLKVAVVHLTFLSLSKHEANTTELHPKVRQTCFSISADNFALHNHISHACHAHDRLIVNLLNKRSI